MAEYEDEILYCQWHPKTETTLRCYQCETPICVKCANRTPVGYICPDCRRGRKKRFENSRPTDYVIAGVVSLLLGFVAGIIPLVGWFVLFLSPLAGGLIAEVVWRLVGRRYSEYLWWIVAAGITLGALPFLLLTLVGGIGALIGGNAFGALSMLWAFLHLPMAVGAAVARLRLH